MFFDLFKHPIQILKNILVPKPDNFKPLFDEPFIPQNILPTLGMLPTINFYDQFIFKTYEINDVGTNDHLSAKFDAKIPGAKYTPEMLFSFCRVIPQFSGNRC